MCIAQWRLLWTMYLQGPQWQLHHDACVGVALGAVVVDLLVCVLVSLADTTGSTADCILAGPLVVTS